MNWKILVVKGQGQTDFMFIQFMQFFLVNAICEEIFERISLNFPQMSAF